MKKMVKRFGKLGTLLIIVCLSVAIVSAATYITIMSTNSKTVTHGTLPTLTLNSNSTTVYDTDTLQVTATLSDGTPNVDVQFYLDGGAVGSPIATNASGVATYTLVITSGYTGGTYTASAQYPHP
jgi:hypothetical protein